MFERLLVGKYARSAGFKESCEVKMSDAARDYEGAAPKCSGKSEVGFGKRH